MIYIVHGDNESASRNTILNLQKKYGAESKQEVLYTEVTPDHLYTLVNNFDFFGNPPFIVLNISNYGHTKLDNFLPTLEKAPDKSVVIIYADKALTTTNIFLKESKNLKATVLYSPAIPSANAFKFSDYVLNGQKQKAYAELKLLDSDEEAFQILGALTFTLRAVVLIKFESTMSKSLAPFVKSKAETLAKSYTEEQLLKMYNLLYTYDIDMKTGAIPVGIVLPMIIEKIANIRA